MKAFIKRALKKLGLYTKKDVQCIADEAAKTAVEERRWELDAEIATEWKRLEHKSALIEEDLCTLRNFALKVGIPVVPPEHIH